MKTIEIYNYDTNETVMTFNTRKSKNIQKAVIDYLKTNNYNFILQGKIIPNVKSDIYWLSYNKNTGQSLKLWYREKEIVKQQEDKYYILDIRLNKEQRQYFESKGYYCYDIRESCLYGDGGCIERNVLVNNCGSIITNKDLGLTDRNYAMRLDDLMDNFKEMSYEEYDSIKKDNGYEL